MSEHRIVMGILRRDDTVLLCHRRPDRRWYPDVWDLPGGHVEAGETRPAALRRELGEELGIDLVPSDQAFDELGFDDVVAAVWLATAWSGEVENRAPEEHDDLGWFTIDQIGDLTISHPAVRDLCLRALREDD